MIKLKRGLFEGDFVLSQPFGTNPEWYKPFGLKGHNGIDYATPVGTKLFSAISGTITETANDKNGYGIYIKIENDECGILYGHLKELPKLKVGDIVKAGDLIAISGNTGNSTGPHLHFGVFPKPRNRDNGYAGYIDPFDKKKIDWVDVYETGVSTDSVDTLRKALEEMTKNKEDWKEKARNLESEIKDLKKEIKEKENSFNKLKLLCEELEQLLNNEKVKNANLSNELSEVKVELDNSSKDVLKYQNELQNIKKINTSNTENNIIINNLKKLKEIYENLKSRKIQ